MSNLVGSAPIQFSDADALAETFEAVMKAAGISLACSTPLERGLLLLNELKRRHETPENNAPWPSLAKDLQEATGILHLIRLVIRNAQHPCFNKVVNHLKLLNRGEPAQTRSSTGIDDASNKIFELAFGLAVMPNARDFDMDDPDKSSAGRNPDILARLTDGLTWGFACKVVHGDAPMTLFERFAEGVEQIERSKAEIGLVVISFKNRFPHEDFLPTMGVDEFGAPLLGAHKDIEALPNRTHEFAKIRASAMLGEVGLKALNDQILGRKALPGFLSPLVVGICAQTEVGPVPTSAGILSLINLESTEPTRFSPTVTKILDQINSGFQV